MKIVQSVTGEKLSELSNAFIRLLISKGRESNLPEIASAAIDLYKQHHNIHTIKLTTATALTDGVRDGIVSQIRQSAGFDKIELEEKVDPALIGGFVLQVGDRLVDASISYDLRAIAKQFDNNDFIYKIR